jgi:hypothetical protein
MENKLAQTIFLTSHALPRMIGHTPLLPGSDTDLENGKKNKNE